MPLGQWSGHIWAGKDLDPLVPLDSRSPTPQIPWRAIDTPSTPPSRLDTRSPAIPSRNGFQSRCSTRCTTRASSRLSNVGRGTKVAKHHSAWRSAKTPSFETPRSLSPKSDSDDEDRQLSKQAETIRQWSSTSQVTESYAQHPFTSLIEESEPLLEPDSALDQRMLMIYQASLELTEVGISTVMAPTVARRFKTALEATERADDCGDADSKSLDFDPFHEVLFKEAMEAYTIYGRMESIVCEMEILIERALQVLNDDGDHGFDIVTGKAIGVGLAPDVDEQKTKIIMERVFELLAALTAEAKSFNYMAWLQAMGESDLEVTELVEEFISQKQEIRKLIWISNIEAEEFLTSRLLTAAMTFAKWFEKMRKAADEFQEFLLKQYQEEGHYGYYQAKKAFQKQTEERKRWAQRLLETKEACKKEAHESQGRRIQAQLEMRREREADKEEQPPPVSGLPISDRARKSRVQIGKSPSTMPAAAERGGARRFSWSSKRSSHMEEQIMALLGHARQHLDELQILAQEQKVREQKAFELLLRMLMKSRVLERRKLRKATTQNISQRVNSLMPGRFVVMHKTKSWSELEDFSVTSSLLQQQAVCKDLNELTVTVELKDIWTGVEGKFLMKKKAKPKKQVIKSLQTQEQKLEAAAKSKMAGNLWGKARDSVAAGSAVSAILGIQANKEAEAAAAREEQLRLEARAQQAQAAEANDYEDDDHEDLFNFPPHFSLVDVQLLLSDAAVTRTEKLRELRQEVSQVVQQVGAQYGREAWDYNAQKLEAHSNYNAWAALMPVVEKEMMSLGESGRFFLSRQDAANLQDLMRMMRSIKSQLAVETANRTHFEDEDDRWSFGSENHIRALIEQLRQLHITLNERKQKAAKLDIRAELTQELAHLHPELRSTYGLVQKHKPPPKAKVEEVKEEEEEEEQDERLNSFKTFLFALKFKHKMSEAQDRSKLRETKVQLQGTIANAQKMMGEDFGLTKKLDEEKELAQSQVHYLKRLLTHIQMNESATYQLKQLRSERAKNKMKAAGAAQGAARLSDPHVARAAPDAAPGEAAGDNSPKGKRGKVKGRRGQGGKPGSPKRNRGQGDDRAPRSWLARASQALVVPTEPDAAPRRSVSPRQSPGQSPRQSMFQIEEPGEAGERGKTTRGTVFFAEDQRSATESDESGIFARPRPTLTKRNTIDDRKAQFNRLFTSTMQRRLRTATDKGAALIFRKSLADASKSQQITSKILDSKRQDLQNLLRLTLQRFGIKTNHRIQSAKEQHARWDGEVEYLNDKLRRGQGMESFWQDRYDGWLSQMEALFGQGVFDAFVHSDHKTDRDQWSQRLQEALYEAFDQMREETPSLAVDVSHHVEVPEEAASERTGTTTVRLGDVHMAKLMDRKPAKQIDTSPAEPPQVFADVLQHNLPEPEPQLVRPPAIPARPMRQPGVTSAALKLPKMPIILQPEEVEPEQSKVISTALASRQLPTWLTGRGNRAQQSSNDLDMELDLDEVSELESKHINLARRRTVQPWLESVEWIEDVSYRAALRSLQKQFYRGKTQEEEAWGFQEPVQHHRHPRKKVTDSITLDRQAERNLSKRMQGFNLEELKEASPPVHRWHTWRRSSKSLRRARPREARAKTARGLDCVVGNHGVRYRGPDRLLFQEPSVATSGTEVTDAPEGGLSSDGGSAASLRRFRRFRRRMLKRFCGAEEAYNFVVSTPIADLDYEAFCELAAQISFNLEHTRMVWDKLWTLLPPEAASGHAGHAPDEAASMRKTEFAHVMSFACSLRDLTTLRIRLQLRYGSLSAAFDHMDRRHLDQESWKELLVSVGASAEEAKNFFMMMMANSNRQSPKISRRSFLLVMRNAEGFAASRSLFHTMKLSNEATAWRTLMEFARRTAKHKGLRQDPSRSITATELHTLLASVSNEMQCEALLRMAVAKQQRDRSSGVLRLEEVLLVAVAGLGQRAEELKKELGRDYDGDDGKFTNLSRQPGTFSASLPRNASAFAATARLRRSMAVSVAEAAGKLQRGEPHQGTMTLLGIVGQRPPSHVRSYQSSDSEDLRSVSSRSAASRARTAGSRSPTRSPRILE